MKLIGATVTVKTNPAMPLNPLREKCHDNYENQMFFALLLPLNRESQYITENHFSFALPSHSPFRESHIRFETHRLFALPSP